MKKIFKNVMFTREIQLDFSIKYVDSLIPDSIVIRIYSIDEPYNFNDYPITDWNPRFLDNINISMPSEITKNWQYDQKYMILGYYNDVAKIIAFGRFINSGIGTEYEVSNAELSGLG